MSITQYGKEVPKLFLGEWSPFGECVQKLSLRGNGVYWLGISEKPLDGTPVRASDVVFISRTFSLGKDLRSLRHALMGRTAHRVGDWLQDTYGPYHVWKDRLYYAKMEVAPPTVSAEKARMLSGPALDQTQLNRLTDHQNTTYVNLLYSSARLRHYIETGVNLVEYVQMD
jgi:hypothetical protein